MLLTTSLISGGRKAARHERKINTTEGREQNMTEKMVISTIVTNTKNKQKTKNTLFKNGMQGRS